MKPDPIPNTVNCAVQNRIARFHAADGTAFTCLMSPGCEQFIGRFVRISELRHHDHVVRFARLETAT
ncbi:hypothetical protein [Parasphingopyxis sp.]|uniref:hypothetical protein n=1 Tax=Parasphingopyxis sp. TaxID=1920299 RepID=UPI002629FEAD|nr:hypothetical protein [Parasphingopyxis sp.]